VLNERVYAAMQCGVVLDHAVLPTFC
jgi:hypothetical protein